MKIRFDPNEYREQKKPTFSIPDDNSDVVAVIRRDGTEEKTSKTSGKPYFNVKAEVISENGKGYFLFYSIPSGEYQMSFLGSLLEGIGIKINKKTEIDMTKVVGKRFKARVRHKTAGGQARAEIAYFHKYDGAITEMDDTPATVDQDEGAGGGNARGNGDESYTEGAEHESFPF